MNGLLSNVWYMQCIHFVVAHEDAVFLSCLEAHLNIDEKKVCEYLSVCAFKRHFRGGDTTLPVPPLPCNPRCRMGNPVLGSLWCSFVRAGWHVLHKRRLTDSLPHLPAALWHWIASFSPPPPTEVSFVMAYVHPSLHEPTTLTHRIFKETSTDKGDLFIMWHPCGTAALLFSMEIWMWLQWPLKRWSHLEGFLWSLSPASSAVEGFLWVRPRLVYLMLHFAVRLKKNTPT